MDQLAGWIAALATMIAAVMTAANLGTRVTGWGFVIFTIGAVAWCMEAWISHQQNLLWSNAVLTFVDAIGIYRWLGRRARLEDGAGAAALKSRVKRQPLFPVFALEGSVLQGSDGYELAHIVGAMADCRTGRIDYIVVKSGGIADGEQFRAVAWADILCGETFGTQLTREELAAMPALDPGDWPATVTPRNETQPDGSPCRQGEPTSLGEW